MSLALAERTAPLPAGAPDRIIKLAALAVGGQGGGVLTDWIVALAERNGFVAQSTSVAGVAQRTGATIYYVEMCPDRGRHPVFALSPAEGDVDILIAAELMEAGRAVVRGFVTPERTTLIASSHRIAAVSEKIVPGRGLAPAAEVEEAAARASKRFVLFDMEAIAVEAGSVISASLFGALAGSGALPFPREGFEATIHASGRGVAASLKAFAIACDRAEGPAPPPAPIPAGPERPADAPLPLGGQPASEAAPGLARPRGNARLLTAWDRLLARAKGLPQPVREMALRGLQKVVDHQDLRYGEEYLDRLDEAVAVDGPDWAFSLAAAKHLANAMAYDDIIRVADLKTRRSRSARVRRELGVRADDVVHVTEYFHPRIEEVCGTLPAGVGAFIERRPRLAGWLDRRVNRGRHVRTDGVAGFATLWLIAGLRPLRRRLLRHRTEREHREAWWRLALATAARDRALGAEILNCRRLIKGYSDTHSRGMSKFERVLGALPHLDGRSDAADWLRRLREAALKDEKGITLDGALRTVASFAAEPPPARIVKTEETQ